MRTLSQVFTVAINLALLYIALLYCITLLVG